MSRAGEGRRASASVAPPDPGTPPESELVVDEAGAVEGAGLGACAVGGGSAVSVSAGEVARAGPEGAAGAETMESAAWAEEEREEEEASGSWVYGGRAVCSGLHKGCGRRCQSTFAHA